MSRGSASHFPSRPTLAAFAGAGHCPVSGGGRRRTAAGAGIPRATNAYAYSHAPRRLPHRPYPMMKASEPLKKLPAGEILEVLTDHAPALVTIPWEGAKNGYQASIGRHSA